MEKSWPKIVTSSRSRPLRLGLAVRPRLWRSPTGRLGLVLVGIVVVVAVLAPLLAPADPWESVASPFVPPGEGFVLGTDDLGRDLLSAVIYGTRTSLLVGMVATLIAVTIGIFLGSISGFAGGLIDDAIMRFTEFFQVIPRFFLALIAVALFRPGVVTITLVLALTSWTLTTRLLRAQVLSTREREYVMASRALGAGPLAVLWRHVLPNAITPVIVQASMMVGQFMLIEASLAFLGLGDPIHVSWGYLLRNAQPFLRVAWWMSAFPGIAIALAVLGFNLLGDGLRDALDPRHRGE